MISRIKYASSAVAFAILFQIPSFASAGDLHRLSADFLAFDGDRSTSISANSVCSSSHDCTPGSTDGALLYEKKIRIPKGDNALFISFTGQSDVHGGAGLWLSCRKDDRFCNPRPFGVTSGSSSPAGWVSLLKLPAPTGGSSNCNNGGGGSADCHDTGIHYQWCIPIDDDDAWMDGVRLKLKLASSLNGQSVFAERIHVFIDSTRLVEERNRCAGYDLDQNAVGSEPRVQVKKASN